MRVVIPAAGYGARWGNYGGITKHQAPINGTPIIQRQINQWYISGYEAQVVGQRQFDYPHARYVTYSPTSFGQSIDKLCRQWWGDEGTIVSFGDVYYTDVAFGEVRKIRNEWTVYARPLSRNNAKYKWPASFFGIYVPHNEKWEILDAMSRFRDTYETPNWQLGNHGALASFYRYLTGQNPAGRTKDRGHMVVIDDETNDVDTPADWRKLQRAVKAAQ